MTKTAKLEENSQEIIRKFYDGVTMTELGKEYGCSNGLIGFFLKTKNVVMKENIAKKNAEKKADVLKLYTEDKSPNDIATQLEMDVNTVRKFLRKAGYKLTTAVPLEDKRDEIIADYNNGLGCFKLSKKYGCSEAGILKLLDRYDVVKRGPERTYSFNEKFFDKIDTQEKAYILGLIAADGSVSDYTMSLSLMDKDIIEKTAVALSANSIIEEPPIKGRQKQQQYKIRLNSKYFVDSLEKVGILHGKTINLKFPSEDIVPIDLIRHWIRGFHDGDGSLIAPTNKGNRYIFKFIGTSHVIRGLEQTITECLNFPVSVFPTTNTKIELLQLACGTRSYVKKFLDWIYEGSTIHMDRKYQRYQDFLKWDRETPRHIHNI